MIDRYRNAAARDPLLPAAVPGGLMKPPRPGPGACAAAVEPPAPQGRRSGAGRKAGRRPGFGAPPAARRNETRRRVCCSACLLAAAFVLWAGTAWGQLPTVSITHTGSATVTDGKVQLVEGGASTTFQVDFEDDFYTTLKAASSYTAVTNPRFFAGITIHRDSTDVSWDTTSGSTAKDRTSEFQISSNGTTVGAEYYAAAGSSHVYRTYREDRLWIGIPVGQPFSFVDPDSFPFSSYPLTFTIKAKSDTSYLEQKESIRVHFAIFVWGSSAEFQIYDTLTFDLVEGALPDPTGKPTTPANLTATAGNRSVELTWNPVDTSSSNTNLLNDVNITRHEYRQSTDGGTNYGSWVSISDSGYGKLYDTGYTVTGLTNETEHTFQVRAVNGCTATTGCGNSDAAAAVMATPSGTAPNPPAGLAATAGNRQVTLTWAAASDAILHEYQQRVGSEGWGDWTRVSHEIHVAREYRFTGLQNGTTYAYRLRATNEDGLVSLPSAVATATPQGGAPAAPVLSATARDGAVTLAWPDPVDSTITVYHYQHRRVGAAAFPPWAQAQDITAPPYVSSDGGTHRFPVSGLTNGTTYEFRVRASNADGMAVSNVVSATPRAGRPAKLTGLRTRTSGGDRWMWWTPPKDPSITHYEYSVTSGTTWRRFPDEPRDTGTQGVWGRLPEGRYTEALFVERIRVRAVNAHGNGPPSEAPVVITTVADPSLVRVAAQNVKHNSWVRKTQPPSTREGTSTFSWDAATDGRLRWWGVKGGGSGSNNFSTVILPIGTTTYERTTEGHLIMYLSVTGCIVKEQCTRLVETQLDGFRPGAPPAPTGFMFTEGDGTLTLTWDQPTHLLVDHYELYMPNHPDYTSSTDIPGGSSVTTVTISDIKDDIRYGFSIRAVSPWGHTSPSVGGYIGPSPPETPRAPTGLTLLRELGQALATWNDPGDPSISGYQYNVGGQDWHDIPGATAATTRAWVSSNPGNLGIIASFANFKLRAVSANGPGAEATRPPASVTPPPSRPTGFRAAPGNGAVTLSWDDPGLDVFIYQYRYTTDGGNTWTTIPGSTTTAQGQMTRAVVPGLTNGQTYEFALIAVNRVRDHHETVERISPVSDAARATPRAAAPAKPTGLSAEPGNAEATLTWDDPHDVSITKYQLKQGNANWADISGSGASTTSHTVESLANGTSYAFRIRAVNDHNGDSTDDPGVASDAVTVTPGLPAAPTGLTATPGDGSVTLRWIDPQDTAITGYEYRQDGTTAAVADSTKDTVTAEVTGLDNGRAYSFAVRARTAHGAGPYSRAVTVLPAHPETPLRPLGFAATGGKRRVLLRWLADPSTHRPVTGYEYRVSADRGVSWDPDWTAVPQEPDEIPTEHVVTGLGAAHEYVFDLRALSGMRRSLVAQATAATSLETVVAELTWSSFGNLPSGSGGARRAVTADLREYHVYVTRDLREDRGWRVTILSNAEIEGKELLIGPLTGAEPVAASGHRFAGVGPEGLSITSTPALRGGGEVCLTPGDDLREEAGQRRLRLMTSVGGGWSPLPTAEEDGRLCASTARVAAAFALGYAAPVSRSAPGPAAPTPADNAAPQAAQPVPPQTVSTRGTSEPLDLTPYFRDPDGDRLNYAAVSNDVSVAIADLPRGSSQLTLHGMAAGQAVVTVTASDPHGGSVSQRLTVTVGGQAGSAPPEVAQRIPPQGVTTGTTGQPLDLTPYFRDPDGDPLTYVAVSYDPDVLVAEVAKSSSELTLRGIADGEAGVIVTAIDPDGGHASQPVTVTVRTGTVLEAAQPIPPQIVEVGAASEPLDLAPYFHDPDGDPLTYVAASDDTDVLVAEVAAGSSQLVLRGVAAGETDVIVVAGDLNGERARQTVTVTVRTNAAPEVVQAIAPQVVEVGAASAPLDLAPYFRDADGDPLTYAAVSHDTGVLSAEVAAGGSALVLRGMAVGEASVIVGASDPFGRWAHQTVRVTVRTGAVAEAAQPMPPQTVVAGAESAPLDLAAYFREADGGPLAYAAESDDVRVVVADLARGGSRLALHGVSVGRAVVIVTASDAFGEQASRSMGVTVRTNAAPEALQPLSPQTVLAGAASEPLDLAAYFRDPDGDPLTFAAVSDDLSVVVAEVPDGGSHLTLRGVAAGEAEVIVTASDPYGGEVSQSMTVRANTAPAVVQPIPPQVLTVGGPSEPLDLAVYFRDPDGEPLAYVAVSDNPGVLVAEVAKGGSQLTLRGVAAGEAVVVVTASDPHGGYATQATMVTVRTNSAPTVVQPIPPQVVALGATSEPLDLAPYFHDPDGDPLTYAAESDSPGVVTAEVPDGGSQLTLRGVAAGEAVIVVTASDPFGGTVSQTLAVRTNSAPTVAQPIPPQVVALGATSEPLDLAAYFRDPDGDPLTYAAESDDPEVMTAAVAGARFTVTGVAAGTALVTVTARDPYDAAASQRVTVTVRVAEPAWVKAWAARFGRTVSGQVLDGVQERLRVSRQAGFEATLAGHHLGGMGDEASQTFADRQPSGAAALRRELDTLAGWMDEQMDHPAGGGTPRQALTGRDLLTSSAFTLTGGDADNGFGALWGRGAVSHFAGEDGALSLDGEVATGMVGADWVSGRWLTGLTLAMSRGTGGYRTADGSGDIESTLTGLYPWMGYHLTERLSLWAALGYGAGVLTVTPQDEAALAADLSLGMVAAGARSEVLRLPRLGGITLAVETDARLTRTTTGATADLPATDASVWQLRLGLEGSRHVALEGGGALRPSIELGLRHDGGDAETGSGIELGAGLGFSKPASGLSLDLAARGLLTHEASGFQEWGASASLTYDPAPSSEEGLSVSLQQSVGASSSGGVHALLGRDTMAEPAAYGGIGGASRLQARVGYGLPIGEARFIGTPQLGFGLSEGRHNYTLGWHLSVAKRQGLDLTLGLEASRRENPDASNPEHGVRLQVRLGH